MSHSSHKVKAIKGVNDVQLRTEVLGKADDKYNSAEIYCYFQDNAEVTKPYIMKGTAYDPTDEDGIWIFYRFADAWELKVGDKLNVHVMGLDIEKTIRGFIATPEYEYACSSSDTETDYHNIGFAYLSSKVLPEEI